MSISPGFTTDEIRDFVHDYHQVAHGKKALWLAARGVTHDVFRRWQAAVFRGDLDRALIPRESSQMKVPPAQRTALEKIRAAEHAMHAAEISKLSARVHELEETNTALGKAIGLLHAMSEEEPETLPTTPDASSS